MLGRSGMKGFISSLLTMTSYNQQLIINLVRAFQGELISASLAWYHGHWIPLKYSMGMEVAHSSKGFLFANENIS